MFYRVFLFLLCLSMFSGTIESKGMRVYIDGYIPENIESANLTSLLYRYEKNETLNISCHSESSIFRITWQENGAVIPGKENHRNINTLQLHINQSHNNYIYTCNASEDGTDLKESEILRSEAFFILHYVGFQDSTTSAPTSAQTSKDTGNVIIPLDKLIWIVVVVAIVLIIICAILTCACIKSCRKQKYRVALNPAVSNTSVFTTGSRTPIIPRHKITKDKVCMHPPVSDASYFTTNSRTPPIPPHKMANDKVCMHPPVSDASYFTTNSRTLPIPPHKMANDQIRFATSNVSYYTTDSGKTSVQHKIAQTRFYTINNNYNKKQLHNSLEIIDSEYQEPIDSQAYCEPQMYSEPEKQFYVEPIPKLLRTKDTAYVNCNKSNGSANSNENIDIYQNCEHISDNEFYYYIETS